VNTAELIKYFDDVYFLLDDVERLEKVCICPELSKQPTEKAKNYFCKGTGFWEVGFQGESDHAKATKGMNYIAYLLSNPGKQISVVDLTRIFDSPPLNNSRYDKMNDTQLEDQGMHSHHGSRIKGGTWKDAEGKARGLLNDFEEAKKGGISLEIDEAQRKYDEYMEYLLSAKKEDSLDLGVEKERKRILNAIDAAIKSLEKKCPMLFAYLNEYIHTGSTCSYVPDKDNLIDWHIES
jgi:hypothetical protein